MPALYTTLGPWTFPTFTLLLALAALVGVGLALRRFGRDGQAGFAADAYLVALIGAIVGARLFHVLLNWDYFSAALPEAFDVRLGGLDWHGAILGGIAGLRLGIWIRERVDARRASPALRHPSFSTLLNALTPALPLLALAGWYGCLAASCAYGAEVDTLANYPRWMVAETTDVYGINAPRYNTQLFGMLWSGLALLLALRHRRFWLVLAFLGAGMFIIGFFRGDHVARLAGLRGDQLFDLGLLVMAVVLMAVSKAGRT